MSTNQPRLVRFQEIADVCNGLANAAHLLACESYPDNRSRITSLVGDIDDAKLPAICTAFKWFMTGLRKEETSVKRSGAHSRSLEANPNEFYRKTFDCARVFSDSTLYFVPALSRENASVPFDDEVVQLIGKGMKNLARSCFGIPDSSSSSAPSARHWMRTISLNNAKRKLISDLRANIRKQQFQIVLLKCKQVVTPSVSSTSRSSQIDQLRRELESAHLEKQDLLDRIEELENEKTIVSKVNGKFNVDFHHLLIRLIALGIPDAKVNDAIRAVSDFLCRSISDFPSLSTIRNDAIAALGLAIQQTKEVLEAVMEGRDITLSSDETTKRRHRIINVARDEKGSKAFCLGIVEVFAKTSTGCITCQSK